LVWGSGGGSSAVGSVTAVGVCWCAVWWGVICCGFCYGGGSVLVCGFVGWGSSAVGSVTVVGVCWCAVLSGGHLPWVLSVLVFWGGSGWRIGRSECVALEIRRIDVLLLVLGGGSGWRIGSSECVTCVLLEIRTVDVLLLVLVLLWCWTLHVTLARFCFAPGIAVQSVSCLLL